MVGPPGRILRYLVPPSALPVLASISGELKSCFTDGIHGGRRSLITAALRVLLGTDCEARHLTTPSATPALFGGVWNAVLLKSAGRCRLVIQLIQWSRATSVTGIFFFFIFLFCCQQQVQGEMSLFFLQQHRCEMSFVLLQFLLLFFTKLTKNN